MRELSTWVGDLQVRRWLQGRAVADPGSPCAGDRCAVAGREVGAGSGGRAVVAERAGSDPDSDVRAEAVGGVGRASGNPGVESWLREWAVDGPGAHRRGRGALVALRYSRDPGLVEWLQRARGQRWGQRHMRQLAIEVLVERASHPDRAALRPRLVEWLQCAVADLDNVGLVFGCSWRRHPGVS